MSAHYAFLLSVVFSLSSSPDPAGLSRVAALWAGFRAHSQQIQWETRCNVELQHGEAALLENTRFPKQEFAGPIYAGGEI